MLVEPPRAVAVLGSSAGDRPGDALGAGEPALLPGRIEGRDERLSQVHVGVLSAVVLGNCIRAIEGLDTAAVLLHPEALDVRKRQLQELVGSGDVSAQRRGRSEEDMRLPVEFLAIIGGRATHDRAPSAKSGI